MASFGAGCSQIVGFKQVSVGDDPKTGDDAGIDGPVDAMAIDAMIGPPPKL